MNIELAHSIPKLRSLPGSLPLDGAIRIELEEGVPVLRASSVVQNRVGTLLLKEREQGLSSECGDGVRLSLLSLGGRVQGAGRSVS